MKRLFKIFSNAILLIILALVQATSSVQAYSNQDPSDFDITLSVDKSSINVNDSAQLTLTIHYYSTQDFWFYGSFSLPAGLEFSGDLKTDCLGGNTDNYLLDTEFFKINGFLFSKNTNYCYLTFDVKGLEVNNYLISIGSNAFNTGDGVVNSTGTSVSLNVLDSSGNTATPTSTSTGTATATPNATNTPIPTDTATTQPTNTSAATSVFTSTPAVTSTTGVIASTKQNQPVTPTQTKKLTAVALVLVLTPTPTELIIDTTQSLTPYITTPTLSAITPTLKVQTTEQIQNHNSTQGNLPISLIIGGAILLLGAGVFGVFQWNKK